MIWQIELRPKARKSLARLNSVIKQRITNYLYQHVAEHPDPLSLAERMYGEFEGLWRFRIGDYRAICSIEKEIITIYVVAIGHRREIYH